MTGQINNQRRTLSVLAILLALAVSLMRPVMAENAIINPAEIPWKSIRLSSNQARAAFALACKNAKASAVMKASFQSASDLLQKSGMGKKTALLAEELAALRFYTTEEGYAAINSFLRHPEKADKNGAFCLAVAQLMCSGLNKMPPSQRVSAKILYRGTVFPKGVGEKIYPKGTTVTHKAFTSTSVARYVAESFADDGGAGGVGVIFRIRHSSGILISNFLDPEFWNYSEGEVLFRPYAKFAVVSIKPGSDDNAGWVLVDLQEK